MANYLRIKAICNPHTKKDGTNLISVQYCHSPKERTILPTGIFIPRTYWNPKQRNILNKLPTNFGDAVLLNQHLNKMIRRAEDLLYLAKETNCQSPIQLLRTYHNTEHTFEEIKEKEQEHKKQYQDLKITPNRDFVFSN